jgi:hypothetical protein
MSGAGFIRRYGYVPGADEISAIEGVVIVDQRTPGPISGASYGVVCVVGEATDMSRACKANTSGEVVQSYRPAEVYGGSDLIEKIGGFDSTLGEFGDEMGNLFVELRNKSFTRLVVAPVDLLTRSSGTQYAIRIWRTLPTSRSATDTTPITAVAPYRVPAGTEFREGSNRILTASPVDFTALPRRSAGVDGTTSVAGLPAATVTITRAAGSFVTDGVVEGDAVVVGSLNAAAASQNLVCSAAGTCRVVSVNTNGLEITIQKQDGSNFVAGTSWAAGAALAYVVYPGSNADSGPENQLSEVAGYTVLARPIVATTAAATALAPSPTPTAASGTYWGPTSGLAGISHPTGALTYEAAVHAPNTAANATLRTRYESAIDSLLNDDTPTNEINIVVSARKDETIQAKLRSHVLAASQVGMTRIAIISPDLRIQAISDVLSSSAPGVGGTGGAVRDERVIYCWPGARTRVPEAVGTSLTCADATTTDDGILDTTTDTWLASLLSNLQPELNPGQAADPVPRVLSSIIGYQRGTPALDMSTYILFKQFGVCALRMARNVGPIFQSNVTTSLTSGATSISRRRMADFIQDSLAARYNQMSKMLGRQSVKDALRSETEAFLSDLLSENNPEAQRIESYTADDKSPNTPTLAARGIHIIKVVVYTLNHLDTIVLQSEVGPSGITVTAS